VGSADVALITQADADRIVDAALFLGEQRGWDAVHMYDIADHMGVGLADLERHFRNKDEIAEAWFRRADHALAACANVQGWTTLSVRERLSRAMRAWFRALEPHKAITVAMLRYKVQPDHIHLVIQGVLRTSSTVQWIREAARVPSTSLRRELEEPALTAIFLSTLATWLVERTPGTPRTWAWMERQLELAEWLVGRLPASSRQADA
jgi:AcrR family transcriptional regulator